MGWFDREPARDESPLMGALDLPELARLVRSR